MYMKPQVASCFGDRLSWLQATGNVATREAIVRYGHAVSDGDDEVGWLDVGDAVNDKGSKR